MSTGLERMLSRISRPESYDRVDGRIVGDKLKSFHAALHDSYQAEWIILNDTEDKTRNKKICKKTTDLV